MTKEAEHFKFFLHILLQWNLYKAEPQGTEIFSTSNKFPHYTKLQQKKMLNPLKSYYLHGAYLFIS
jgi:hypothetical protein